MRTYCTLFDKNYLPQYLTLYDTLTTHVKDFEIHCFCMDDSSYDYLKKLNYNNVTIIPLQLLEGTYPELYNVKENRSRVEYYFTCTASICSYVFKHNPNLDLLTYLDADLMFFSSPEPIYEELVNKSVGIIDHKFYGIGKRYEKYGKYNVGWITFVNNTEGRKCLEDWRTDCIAWCKDILEDGKFADQKYLDYWQANYKGVHVIKHLGANVAPWNVGQYLLELDLNNNVTINKQPLIFYHFASLKQISSNEYITNVSKYFVKMTGVLLNNIYLPYIYLVRQHNSTLGIAQNYKIRQSVVSSTIEEKLRNMLNSFRQFICNDLIKI